MAAGANIRFAMDFAGMPSKAAGGTRAFSFCLKLEGTENLEFDGSSSDNFGFFTDGQILTQTDAQADGMGGQ